MPLFQSIFHHHIAVSSLNAEYVVRFSFRIVFFYLVATGWILTSAYLRTHLGLGPARNYPSESKRVLVRTGKVIITRNVTWAHVPFSRPPTPRSTPSVEGEGCNHGRNLEAGSFGRVTELRDDESESSAKGVEMVTSEADDTKRQNTPLVSGRAVLTTSCAGSSVHSGVYFDPKGQGTFGEGLADAPATSESFLCGPDQQFAALCAGEAKRLAERIPGPLRATIFKGRTRAEERRSKTNAQTGLARYRASR